ncbi:hypothetical protein ACFL3V_03595 [Nanoarchaeota archaeon]
MEVHPIAKVLAEKGVDSVDLSMFDEFKKQEIYSQAADILFRLNRPEQGMIALERAGRPLPVDQLKRMAENKIMLGQHQEAYDLLVKTGHAEMAEFIKQNFLS